MFRLLSARFSRFSEQNDDWFRLAFHVLSEWCLKTNQINQTKQLEILFFYLFIKQLDYLFFFYSLLSNNSIHVAVKTIIFRLCFYNKQSQAKRF